MIVTAEQGAIQKPQQNSSSVHGPPVTALGEKGTALVKINFMFNGIEYPFWFWSHCVD